MHIIKNSNSIYCFIFSLCLVFCGTDLLRLMLMSKYIQQSVSVNNIKISHKKHAFFENYITIIYDKEYFCFCPRFHLDMYLVKAVIILLITSKLLILLHIWMAFWYGKESSESASDFVCTICWPFPKWSISALTFFQLFQDFTFGFPF